MVIFLEVKMVGRVAVKALVYFEVVSTFALLLGLIVANVCIRVLGFPVKPMPPQLPELPNRPAR